MQTNPKNIYTAGDIAELYRRIDVTRTSALEMGKTAGYNIGVLTRQLPMWY